MKIPRSTSNEYATEEAELHPKKLSSPKSTYTFPSGSSTVSNETMSAKGGGEINYLTSEEPPFKVFSF